MPANGLALVIIAACSGYFFVTHSYYFKYQAARKTGQHLYLMATSWGLFFVFITCLLAYLLNYAAYPSSHFYSEWSRQGLSLWLHFMAGVFAVSGLSILISNQLRDKAAALYDASNEDDLSRMIMIAIAEEKPLQVTLDNRKAYVGFVIDTVEPNKDLSFLTLFPMYSGYRDEDSLELNLTNDYFTNETFEKLSESDVNDFGIVIPRAKIVTGHIFNTDLHKIISDQRKP